MIRIAAAAAAVPTITATTPARVAPARQSRAPVPVVAERIPELLRPVPFESQELHGLLGDRMRINVEGRLLHIDEKACLSGFAHRNTAGDFDAAWVGEHAGKFLDAACSAVRYREHPALRSLMDRMAQTLLGSQERDGYLGTYPIARRWTGWDVWVHKYTLIGLLSYYELTGDPAVLQGCRAAGDLLVQTFGDGAGQRDIITAGEHIGMAATSVLEPMCKLYRFTGDPRHLELCRYVVRSYDQPHGPRIVTALAEGSGVYRVANGKAYEMLSNFNGLVDLYRLTGEARLLTAVLHAWDDIARHQLYRTGSASAAEHFQPEGRLLSLQSSNVGEMCVTVTWLQLNWRLWRLTGEARFGHEIERTVYNQLLAAQDAGNGNISYYTSCAGAKEFTDALLCCVSSGPRGIALIPQLAWGLQRDGLFINLYTAGRARFQVDGSPVEVRCETRFPAEGQVRLAVNVQRAAHFTIRLRVPEWTRDFEVRSGSETLAGKPGQLLEIARTWTSPSTLDIEMQMPTRAWHAEPTYPDYALVQRGPQVLALERAVNPTVPYLHRVSLTDAREHVAPKAVAAPAGWAGRQVYEVAGLVGVPEDGQTLRLERRAVHLVPFADLNDGRVWSTRVERARRDPPAITAFARASLSVVSLGLEPTADRRIATDIAEFVSDEDPHSYCTINPRDPGLANYLGAPPGKHGDPVWFAVILRSPATVARIVYRHGAVSAAGGWFDTTETLPRIEVARASIPMSANYAVPDDSKIHWETVAELEHYPRTNSGSPPALTDGQAFEVRLRQPLEVFGIRILGRPGGEYASCAELAAYG